MPFQRFFLLISFLALMLMVWKGHADNGPSWYVNELIQTGQDVEINISYVTVTTEDPPFSLNLERSTVFGEVVVVFDSTRLWEDDAESITTPSCGIVAYDPDICAEYPDDCVDCDGDGVLECTSDFCWINYQFSLIDECVSPYIWRYQDDTMSGKEISVTDTGDSCLGDDTSCSVSSVNGNTAGSGLLALIMASIGLFF